MRYLLTSVLIAAAYSSPALADQPTTEYRVGLAVPLVADRLSCSPCAALGVPDDYSELYSGLMLGVTADLISGYAEGPFVGIGADLSVGVGAITIFLGDQQASDPVQIGSSMAAVDGRLGYRLNGGFSIFCTAGLRASRFTREPVLMFISAEIGGGIALEPEVGSDGIYLEFKVLGSIASDARLESDDLHLPSYMTPNSASATLEFGYHWR